MISPGVRIVDLEPEGFAHLCSALARRERAGAALQVLHDAGRVMRVVHSARGPLAEYREGFGDPARRASELLETTGVDRVVLVDRRGLGGLCADIDALAVPSRTQPELLWMAADRFWSHPAVATAPAPPLSPWPVIQRRLAALGDDFWAVMCAWRGDELFLSLLARFEYGSMTLLTSLDERPRRGQALRVLERAEPMPLALLCDVEALDEALGADDLLDGIRRLVRGPGCIYARGIEEAICKPLD